MNKILEVNDLVVHFNAFAGQVQAIRGISFDLNQGETLAIVGESGSGKSVTVKAIAHLLADNARIKNGSVKYNGEEILNLNDKEFYPYRGNHISMIFQDPLSSLNPIMKIGQQIMEALIIKQKMNRKEAKAEAINLMRAVEIPDVEKRFNQYPFQFSGGMRQRIVIAIALACNPKLLICDEPTTALDVTIQAQILDLIKRLKKERNLSVIFITHDLGVVANIADRVAVMYAGKIVEIGKVIEIFFNPKHPYTWALLGSMPGLDTQAGDKLMTIAGTQPNMLHPPVGDAFAQRNKYAMKIDFEQEPPLFKISETHYAATWLLHKDAPKVSLPKELQARLWQQLKEANL